MSEIFDLSTSAASNTELFPENMQFRAVNDGGREVQAQLARQYKDTSGAISSGGSANAFTITSNRTVSSFAQGMRFSFKANHTITGACTLSVNGGTAREIVTADGASLIAGDILSSQIVEVSYRTDLLKWQLLSASARTIPDTDAIQDGAADYITDNPDDVRADLWVLRPIASATTTSAPTGAVNGTLYIVPTGATRSTWPSNAGLIAEASGGSWTYHTPSEGWSVFAKDTDTVYVYDTAWNAIVSDAQGTDGLASALFQHQEASGTDGGSAALGWNERTVNTTVSNGISGASLSSNAMVIPTGSYLCSVSVTCYGGSGGSDFQAKIESTGQTFLSNNAGGIPSGEVQSPATISWTFPVDVAGATESFKLYTYHSSAKSTDGFGAAVGTGGAEVYASVSFVAIDATRGNKGDDGDPGADGAGYLASSSTSLLIATGSKAFTTSAGLAFQSGDNVRAASAADPTTNYMVGSVASYSGTTLTLTVTDTGGSGTYADWTLSLTGEKGETGDAGADGTDPDIRWNYDSSTTTNADPGTGDLRLNNSSLNLVTEIAVSYACGETGGPDVEDWVKSWDDSTNTAHIGTLIIKKASAPQNFGIYTIASVITDATTYGRFTLDHVASSGSLTNGDVLSVQFLRSGNKGTDGVGSGTVSSVDVSVPSIMSASGGPITETGTIALSLASQSANRVFAGPTTGAATTPAFRALVAADLPASGATAGTYNSVTVTSTGIVTSGTNLSTPTVQTFTASGTWTRPTGCRAVRVTCVGGGGGGGGCPLAASTASSGGAPGGAGTEASAWLNVEAISSASVTVGAGGAGGASGSASVGTNGTASSFGAYLTAPGGGGAPAGLASATTFGLNTVAVSGGAGGAAASAASGAQILAEATGQSGGRIYRTAAKFIDQNAGGSTRFGSGGAGRVTSGAGNPGTGYGSGGGGAAAFAGGAAAAGGDGADGIVIVEEFY